MGTGFLLAFAASVKVKVCTPFGKETVSAMFSGDPPATLLAQPIGPAWSQGLKAEMTGNTTAGVMAVPSLGYVQRGWSQEEEWLFVAAEEAVAENWKEGSDAFDASSVSFDKAYLRALLTSESPVQAKLTKDSRHNITLSTREKVASRPLIEENTFLIFLASLNLWQLDLLFVFVADPSM